MNTVNQNQIAAKLATTIVLLDEQAVSQGFKNLSYRVGDKQFKVHVNVGSTGGKSKEFDSLSKAVTYYNAIELKE